MSVHSVKGVLVLVAQVLGLFVVCCLIALALMFTSAAAADKVAIQFDEVLICDEPHYDYCEVPDGWLTKQLTWPEFVKHELGADYEIVGLLYDQDAQVVKVFVNTKTALYL